MTNSERNESESDLYSNNSNTHKTEQSSKNIIDQNTESNPNIAEKKLNMKKDKCDYQTKYIEFLQNLHQANKK